MSIMSRSASSFAKHVRMLCCNYKESCWQKAAGVLAASDHNTSSSNDHIQREHAPTANHRNAALLQGSPGRNWQDLFLIFFCILKNNMHLVVDIWWYSMWLWLCLCMSQYIRGFAGAYLALQFPYTSSTNQNKNRLRTAVSKWVVYEKFQQSKESSVHRSNRVDPDLLCILACLHQWDLTTRTLLGS